MNSKIKVRSVGFGRSKSSLSSFFLICAALASGLAHANLVTNPSFETFNGSITTQGQQIASGSTTLTGWGVVNGEIAILETPNVYNLTASDGVNFLDLAGFTNTGFPKGISQNISGLAVGQQYAFSIRYRAAQAAGVTPCLFLFHALHAYESGGTHLRTVRWASATSAT